MNRRELVRRIGATLAMTFASWRIASSAPLPAWDSPPVLRFYKLGQEAKVSWKATLGQARIPRFAKDGSVTYHLGPRQFGEVVTLPSETPSLALMLDILSYFDRRQTAILHENQQ